MSEISTSIAEYVHSQTLSTVALVGNRHFAGAEYMSDLRSRLLAYEDNGAIVHLEGVARLEDNQVESLPDDTKKSYQGLVTLLELSKMTAISEGLVGLNSPGERPVSWENHDASLLELATQMNRRQKKVLALICHLGELVMGEDTEYSMQKPGVDDHELPDAVMKIAHGVGRFVGARLVSTFNSVIVDYRNEIALQAVDAELKNNPSQSFALLWGEAHLAGLGLGLENRGYRKAAVHILDPST